DGKPQTLVQFTLAGRPRAPEAAAVPPQADAPEAAAASAEATRGPGRSIVVVVDDLHIAAGNLEFTKQALRRFVDEMVVEDDRVALVTTGAPPLIQQLTEDRAILRQAINRLYARPAALPPARGSQMTPAQAEMILAGDRNALQLAMRTMLAEPGSLLAN